MRLGEASYGQPAVGLSFVRPHEALEFLACRPLVNGLGDEAGSIDTHPTALGRFDPQAG